MPDTKRRTDEMGAFSCWLFLFMALAPIAVEPQVALTPQMYRDADAYDVYSAVIPMDTWYWQNSKALLILGEIPPKEWALGSSPRGVFQGDTEFSKTFESVFKSFEIANQKSMVLEQHFVLQKPYRVVTKVELDEAFRRPPQNGIQDAWEGFRETFPDSSGYLILSGVGFNTDRTLAVVYVEHRCGNLCGAAQYYILEKRNRRWVRANPEGLKTEMRADS
jgi:hypothetical protein